MNRNSYRFEYTKFYEYYTNPKNLFTDKNKPIKLNFFNKTTKKGDKMPKICNPSITGDRCTFIIINGIKIYVADYENVEPRKRDTKELLFSIPTEINGNSYDFHFHFGIRFDDYYKTNIIFFHKTEQHLDETGEMGMFSHKDCHFFDNTEIQRVNDIICKNLNSLNYTMETKLKDAEDLKILEKIMSLPFIMHGGKTKKRQLKNKRTHKFYNRNNILKKSFLLKREGSKGISPSGFALFRRFP